MVTHGGTATYVIAAWIRMPLESAGSVTFVTSPGGITELATDEFDHDLRVVVLNDLTHLR